MQVTQAQMGQMLHASPALLREAICRQVQEEHAYVAQGLPRPVLERMVDSGMQRAQAHGLVAPPEQATFVLLMFEFGPEFWRHPEVAKTLARPGATPAQRLQAVVDETPEAVWRYLESALHRQRWFPDAHDDDEGAH